METHSDIRRIDRIYVKYYFYSLKQRTVPLFPLKDLRSIKNIEGATFIYSLWEGYLVVRKVKPGKIIPIHTFHPDQYGSLFSPKIEQLSDGEVFEV